MSRQKITVPQDLYRAVEEYRKQRGIASWAQAAVELLALALGKEPPKSEWGGKRK